MDGCDRDIGSASYSRHWSGSYMVDTRCSGRQKKVCLPVRYGRTALLVLLLLCSGTMGYLYIMLLLYMGMA